MSRPDWSSLPAALQAEVGRALGSPVVAAASQSGGWSPGVAALVRCADGRTAFVKAADGSLNAFTVDLHRREAEVTAVLPRRLEAPGLLAVCDSPPWYALALTAVEGRPPALPWTDGELDAALTALAVLHAEPAPPGLPPVEQVLGDDLDRWPLVVPEALPAAEAAALPRLTAVERDWRDAVAGDRLLHLDVRSDNLLVRPDGRAVLVDWPWAAVGAPLLDLLLFAPSVVLDGGPGVDELLSRAGLTADPDAVTTVGAALLGTMRWRSLQPAPPGMPGLRAFQAAQADVLSEWVLPRLGARRAG